ncbi:PREDICTED: S-antigen protein-like, partial [Nicotiana attenuata]|uniref:S-antigen protein-like n=1 Tax=Nicotiana attenuata TaxID=49451 RepID=UPI000904DABA
GHRWFCVVTTRTKEQGGGRGPTRNGERCRCGGVVGRRPKGRGEGPRRRPGAEEPGPERRKEAAGTGRERPRNKGTAPRRGPKDRGGDGPVKKRKPRVCRTKTGGGEGPRLRRGPGGLGARAGRRSAAGSVVRVVRTEENEGHAPPDKKDRGGRGGPENAKAARRPKRAVGGTTPGGRGPKGAENRSARRGGGRGSDSMSSVRE